MHLSAELGELLELSDKNKKSFPFSNFKETKDLLSPA
jgi:hypothetical protein